MLKGYVIPLLGCLLSDGGGTGTGYLKLRGIGVCVCDIELLVIKLNLKLTYQESLIMTFYMPLVKAPHKILRIWLDLLKVCNTCIFQLTVSCLILIICFVSFVK